MKLFEAIKQILRDYKKSDRMYRAIVVMEGLKKEATVNRLQIGNLRKNGYLTKTQKLPGGTIMVKGTKTFSFTKIRDRDAKGKMIDEAKELTGPKFEVRGIKFEKL